MSRCTSRFRCRGSSSSSTGCGRSRGSVCGMVVVVRVVVG